MKKMTQKWDLETSNAEIELKIGIYAKNRARQVLLKIFYYDQSQWSMVNGQSQRMTCANMAVWPHLKAYVAVHEAEQARGARGNWRVRCVGAWERHWQRVERVLARQKLQVAWGHV